MQNKKFFKIIIFIVVLCIPIIYSFFYLKSYWDPYGNLTDMKIAIVNLDKGVDGTNQGSELVKELKDKDVMDICEVSQDEANEGLQNAEYYATITIPSNFTECLNSAKEEDKKVATITYSPNQQSNYLASQIINKVVTATEMELQSKVGKEVVSTLSDTLAEVPDSLQEISDGADKIYDGTSDLNSGLKDLNSGIGLLDSKYTDFDNGVKSAYAGSSSLNNGVSQVNEGVASLESGATTLDDAIAQINAGVDSLSSNGGDKISTLTQGIDNLNNGAEQVNAGVQSYTQNTDNLAKNIQSYTTLVNQLDGNQNQLLQSIIDYDNAINGNGVTNEQINQMAQSAKAIIAGKEKYKLEDNGKAIAAGAKSLSAKSDEVRAGAQSLKNGTETLKSSSSEISGLMAKIGTLKTGLTSVKNGTETLKNGLSTLKVGGTQVQSGAQSLETGLKTLSTSSETVKDSLNKLDEGSTSAVEGSQTLLDGVDTFKTEINNGLEESKTELTKLNGLNDFVSDPVKIEEEDYGEVSSYGIAFTPLFLSIGLWVGALMCYVVLYYDQRHRFGKLDYNAKNKILQNLMYIGIGLIDGVVTGLVLKFGLGFDVTNMGVYLLECAITGGVFMTIIQFLIRNFGDIGKFLALIILVLQLAAAGGTFPVETIDKGFRFLNPLLPMTYTIKVFKECLISTSTNFIGKNTLVLIGFAVVLGVITLGVEIIKMKKEKNNAKDAKNA